jgi:adenylyltransferase/sulfurtransferase
VPRPSRELSPDELDVYSRQLLYDEIGFEGQQALKNARVAVVGVGGLGSVSAQQLAAMGVGYLRLIDRDVVARSDLHRQYLYDDLEVGIPKVEAAARRLGRLNPRIEIDPIATSLSPHNAEQLVQEVDVVIDGLDRVAPRYVLNRAAVRHGIPYVFGAAISSYGNLTTVVPHDTPCLECFYSGLDDEQLDKCAVVGVHPSVLGTIASLQVAEAVSLITQRPARLKGRLLYVDLKSLAFDFVDIVRNEQCPACREGASGARALPLEPVEIACGRDGKAVFVINPEADQRLDLHLLAEQVRAQGMPVGGRSQLGLTFHPTSATSFTILQSGVAVVQVAPPTPDLERLKAESLATYRRVLAAQPVAPRV